MSVSNECRSNLRKRISSEESVQPPHKQMKPVLEDFLTVSSALPGILQYLNRTDLISCHLVNRRLYHVIKRNSRLIKKEEMKITIQRSPKSYMMLIRRERDQFHSTEKIEVWPGNATSTISLPGNLFRKHRSGYFGGKTLIDSLQLVLETFMTRCHLLSLQFQNMGNMKEEELVAIDQSISDHLVRGCKQLIIEKDYHTCQNDFSFADLALKLGSQCVLLYRSLDDICVGRPEKNFESVNVLIQTDEAWTSVDMERLLRLWIEQQFSVRSLEISTGLPLVVKRGLLKQRYGSRWNKLLRLMEAPKGVDQFTLIREKDEATLCVQYVKATHTVICKQFAPSPKNVLITSI